MPKVSFGNIMFDRRYANKEHPCADNPEPLTWEGCDYKKGDDKLTKFREAGYHASCFPEGDGIAFKPLEDQSNQQILNDIINILGFEIF